MHLEKEQSRQRMKEIRALWREFDPIGVYASPNDCPPDEYDNTLLLAYDCWSSALQQKS
jgi:hypothetical protein